MKILLLGTYLYMGKLLHGYTVNYLYIYIMSNVIIYGFTSYGFYLYFFGAHKQPRPSVTTCPIWPGYLTSEQWLLNSPPLDATIEAYLKFEIQRNVSNCVFCVTGLLERKKGVSTASLSETFPLFKYVTMSCTMLWRGISKIKQKHHLNDKKDTTKL